MCGITGYIGHQSAVEIALTNLKRLEYRGYDSAGVAFPDGSKIDPKIQIVRATGKIVNLEHKLAEADSEAVWQAHSAIAHTRWATHGRPTEANAHPHSDESGRLAVVHNGIIENYAELRRELIELGFHFTSETDTEVLPHLIERERRSAGNEHSAQAVAAAIRSALNLVTGSYAIAVLSQDAPDTLFVARKDSPLVIGMGDGENFIASDIPAVMRYTRRVVLMQDGDVATITANSVTITGLDGVPVEREPMQVTWDDAAAEKGGYEHFMLKEIFEEPRTVRDTLRGRLTEDGRITLPGLPFSPADWQRFKRITLVGCGTAYNAGVVGKRLFEQLLRRPTEVGIASEFRYSDPLVDAETLVVLISLGHEYGVLQL